MTYKRPVFPFTAIVGQEKMKKALVLNAINPNLGGVLIRGQKGTAKSTAARALANLLPQIDVVKDCPFNCDPANKDKMCEGCLNRVAGGEKLPIIKRKMKVIDLPLGATEDRVLGTLDIEHAIKKGEKIFESGILASANRGILYIDEVNLLDDHLVDILLDSAAMGVNTVEREGISFSHPARFILIGTMNPEEGELRPQLLDRFGLCVEIEGLFEPKMRIEVIERNIQYEKDPISFIKRWQSEEERLCQVIVNAKEILPKVTYDNEILELIANICIEMGVDGHRADISMLKVAKTIASYNQRAYVTEEDVREAAEFVLLHRMRKKPFQEPKIDKEKLENSIQRHKKQENQTISAPEQQNKSQQENQNKPDSQKEVIFESGNPYPIKRISLPKDKEVKEGSGRRSKAISDTRCGRYIRSKIPNSKTDEIAIDATLRAAAPYQLNRQAPDNGIIIKPQDIRQKVREKKIGNTIMFVVDSSGSMGVNKRMVEIKGAILSLLIDAYQKRDRIGLVAFKGKEASVLLSPTNSVDLAKKQLEELPTGGRTPLSKGLLLGFDVLRNELNKNKEIKPLLVVISDGRANVGINNNLNPFDEVKQIAQEIKNAGIKSLIIDTETGFIRLGRLEELSEILGARYYQLEDIEACAISNLVKGAVKI